MTSRLEQRYFLSDCSLNDQTSSSRDPVAEAIALEFNIV